MISVFTPTYNRAYSLPALYESLLSQINKDFEWLIVDDGSTDGTRELVEGWLEKSPFPIRYSYQENGGKHRAINKGTLLAEGEWFFIVDSDDTLPEDSLEIADRWIKTVKDDEKFAGVSGLKFLPNGSPVAGYLSQNSYDWYMFEREYHNDMAEIYRTDILKQFPFPDFQGEKFCPESLVWNRIGLHYKVRYFNSPIYECEYLKDGLSANNLLNRRCSPSYSCLLYKELLNRRYPLKRQFRAAVNYWRFWLLKKNRKMEVLPLYVYCFFVFGWILKKYDDIRIRYV